MIILGSHRDSGCMADCDPHPQLAQGRQSAVKRLCSSQSNVGETQTRSGGSSRGRRQLGPAATANVCRRSLDGCVLELVSPYAPPPSATVYDSILVYDAGAEHHHTVHSRLRMVASVDRPCGGTKSAATATWLRVSAGDNGTSVIRSPAEPLYFRSGSALVRLYARPPRG